ncbi:MAG: hypothetical protein FWG15_06815 [Propionibacteriaceae bacterium]|nr:hypothetical protein [Propionibacteriaceae bacterium]
MSVIISLEEFGVNSSSPGVSWSLSVRKAVPIPSTFIPHYLGHSRTLPERIHARSLTGSVTLIAIPAHEMDALFTTGQTGELTHLKGSTQ